MREGTIMIDAGRTTVVVMDIEEHREWVGEAGNRRQAEAQSVDKNTGQPVWKITAAVKGMKDLVSVVVPSAQRPDIDELSQIQLDQPVMRIWAAKAGGFGAEITAAGIASAVATK